MDTIPVITTDSSLCNHIKLLIERYATSTGIAIDVVFLDDRDAAVEHLKIEMPDMSIINFSDPSFDPFSLLDTIMADPWLLHGGIIAVCNDLDKMERLEQTRGVNIIVNLSENELEKQLPRVMHIIDNNRRILFQRGIGSDFLHNISGSFKLDNDPVDAICYTNLVCNFLCNANKVSIENKNYLRLALYELLINAVEHGNCGITYEEKSFWLDNYGSINDLIAEKCKDPLIANRKTLFEYSIRPECTTFLVADEGEGFDWRSLAEKKIEDNVFELHGRGIAMARRFSRNLTYNDKGNEVRFEITYEQNSESVKPGLFENFDSIDVKPGDVIFQEGELSNFLHYIVKGRYDVIVGKKHISSLSEDDVFMGEMSFLLNNRRSATVKASTPGKLITLSKKQFVESIRKKPHYALFLSRLLAQRIQRANMTKSRSVGETAYMDSN